MEHKEIKLNKKTIYKTSDNVNYVEMLVPEEWSITIADNRDNYGGYSYPYTFKIKLRSPDKTALLTYFSPRNYLDNHLYRYTNGQIDDYGDLMRKFESIEDYLGKWADSDLKDYANVKEIDKITYSNTEQLRKEREEKASKRAQDNGQQLNGFYYNRIARVYSYKYEGYDRIRLYAGLIEGEDRSQWSIIPVPSYDPFMISTMKSAFPDMQYDQKSGQYLHMTMNETLWNVRCLYSFDCLEKDYEYLYKNVFSPVLNTGVTICDDIWNDFKRIRDEKSAELKRIREDKKEAQRIRNEADRQRRESQKSFYESIRKTQQETHDIINSSYENQRRSQAKVREMWGDVNQGNTRFVDRHGNEHVIHTYNNYAYKSGDTYVTSDSPLDHSYDWEELEKKKY